MKSLVKKIRWVIGASLLVVLTSNSVNANTVEVIVDNEDAEFSVEFGTWDVENGIPDAFGGSHRIHGQGLGTERVRFTPDLPVDGTYEVYARWVSSENRATNATYTVTYSGGAALAPTNQQNPPAPDLTIGIFDFELLGTFDFQAGTSGHVEVGTAGANGAVSADAVQFTLIPEPSTFALAVLGMLTPLRGGRRRQRGD